MYVGRVVVAARIGGAVLGLGDRDVAHPVEDAFDADPALGPGERRARAGVDAVAERDVLAGVDAVGVELVGALEAARVAVRGARRRTITVVPAGMSTPPTVVGTRDSRKSPLIGLSNRNVSSTKFGMRSRLGVQQRLRDRGRSPSSWSADASRRTVVSCPAANRFAATRTTSMTSGSEPSGNVAVARPVITSSAGSRRRSSTYSVKRA